MEDDNIQLKDEREEYFEKSGCGPILAALGIIVAFWIAVIAFSVYR